MLVAEFLEEYRWEPAGERLALLADEPDSTAGPSLNERLAGRAGLGRSP